jgi:hypothetical protein
MNILEFTKKFYVISTMTDDFINNLAPRIAGNVAVRHFKDNFQNQGFEGRNGKKLNAVFLVQLLTNITPFIILQEPLV